MNDKYTQDSTCTLKGHWWIPGSEVRVAGEVEYTEEEIDLFLYGGLCAAIVDAFATSRPEHEPSIIHGETLDGELVTILGAFYKHWQRDGTFWDPPGSQSGMRHSRLHCPQLLIGTHIQTHDTPFSACRVNVPCIETWLDDHPFSVDAQNLSTGRASLQYERPSTEEYKINGCVISTPRTVRLPGWPDYSPSIQHSAVVELAPEKERPLKWYSEQTQSMVDLLSLMYGRPLNSRRMEVKAGNEWAAVLYPRHGLQVQEIPRHEMLLGHNEVKQFFPEALQKWFTLPRYYQRARRLLRSSEHRPASFIELRFLPLVQAFEIWTHCLSKFRDIHLRVRLNTILASLQPQTRRLFCVDDGQFIDGIVNTRNHFTHYTTKRGAKILQDKELHWAIRKLSLMLRILLLRAIGIPEEVLQGAIGSHLRCRRQRDVWGALTELGTAYDDPCKL